MYVFVCVRWDGDASVVPVSSWESPIPFWIGRRQRLKCTPKHGPIWAALVGRWSRKARFATPQCREGRAGPG